MDIISKGNIAESSFSTGLIYQPLLWSIASIKYHLSNIPDNIAVILGYIPITRFGNVIVYKNNHFIPLGFTYNHFISLSQFRKLEQNQKNIVLQKAFVVEEPINNEVKRKLKEFDLRDLPNAYTTDVYFHDIELLRQDTLHITKFSQNNINGTIKVNNAKLLFFSIPYDKGWKAIIDGKWVKPMLCNIGFIGFLLDPGEHNIKLIYKPPYFFLSLIASITGLSIYIGLIIVDLLLLKRRSMIKS
jgi:uncharacterized membrane protein YfhO